MLPAPFRVVLDANVIYPFSLRDTLLRAAAAEFFQLYWSEQILDEVMRNLVDQRRMSREQAAYLRSKMTEAFPEAMVSGHESLIAAMANDEKDRHVVAAAVKIGAQVIVTRNLRDFRTLPEGIEAQSPDDFLCSLLEIDPTDMVALVRAQAAALKRPPHTIEELLHGLAHSVPDFVSLVRGYI